MKGKTRAVLRSESIMKSESRVALWLSFGLTKAFYLNKIVLVGPDLRCSVKADRMKGPAAYNG